MYNFHLNGSFLWFLFILLIKNVYSTKNQLFFFEVHPFLRKNPIIRIFDYKNGTWAQLIRIIEVIL